MPQKLLFCRGGQDKENRQVACGHHGAHRGAAFHTDLPGPGELVELADKALYMAKQKDRDRIESLPGW